MKTIRSNKKGFGIHSPFVYDLVTNVLFVKTEISGFEEIEKLNLGRKVNKRYKKLLRLINYFLPEKIYVDSFPDDAELSILKKRFCFVFEEIKLGFPGTTNLITENHKAFYLLEELPDIDFNEIQSGYWFIKNKSDKKEIKFKILPIMEKKRGIILIEFNYDAFIIFDKKFPSQHYVIK